MGNTPPQEPTGQEAQALLEKARAAGHLPDGFVERELAAIRGKTGDDLRAAGHVQGEADAGRVEGADAKRELSPEDQRELLATLKSRFGRNKKLHPKTQWTHVEKSLKARPDLMWSLQQLEVTGGEPDVIKDVEGAYVFGDCSTESPSGRRNCVYDKAAEEGLPEGSFNGNAVDMVDGYGADLMDEDQYRALQKLIALDSNTASWLKTPADVRESGYALRGDRIGLGVGVYRDDPSYRVDARGFRAALRVPKVS